MRKKSLLSHHDFMMRAMQQSVLGIIKILKFVKYSDPIFTYSLERTLKWKYFKKRTFQFGFRGVNPWKCVELSARSRHFYELQYWFCPRGATGKLFLKSRPERVFSRGFSISWFDSLASRPISMQSDYFTFLTPFQVAQREPNRKPILQLNHVYL